MSWNRQEGKSEKTTNKRRGGRFRVPPVLFVPLVLLALAAGVWWAVRGHAGRIPADREGRAPSRPIAEAKPVRAPRSAEPAPKLAAQTGLCIAFVLTPYFD